MLKPNRKITRKEIKRDPFLETIDKLEFKFEQNKRTFFNVILFIIAGIIGVNFLITKQSQNRIDANSALGIALIAFDNGDYDNAKFQFESIISEFSGTTASNVANFYLGTIHFQNNDYLKSEEFLNAFIESKKPALIYVGAIKMLSHIAMQRNDYSKAIELIDNANKSMDNDHAVHLSLLKARILKDKGDLDLARDILTEITSQNNLPIKIRQESEELMGMF